MSGIPYAATPASMLNPLGMNSILGDQLGGLGNMLGNAQSPLAQSQMDSLAAYQQAMSLNHLLNMQQNAVAPVRTGFWERERAKACVEQAELLIQKIAFWRGVAQVRFVGVIALPRLARLASKLDAAVEEAERFLEMAAKYDNEKEQGTNA